MIKRCGPHFDWLTAQLTLAFISLVDCCNIHSLHESRAKSCPAPMFCITEKLLRLSALKIFTPIFRMRVIPCFGVIALTIFTIGLIATPPVFIKGRDIQYALTDTADLLCFLIDSLTDKQNVRTVYAMLPVIVVAKRAAFKPFDTDDPAMDAATL